MNIGDFQFQLTLILKDKFHSCKVSAYDRTSYDDTYIWTEILISNKTSYRIMLTQCQVIVISITYKSNLQGKYIYGANAVILTNQE